MGTVSIQTPTPFGIGDGTTKSFSVGGTGEVVDSMNVKSIYRADANGNNLLYQNVGPLAPGSYPQYPQGINNAICNRSTSATYIDKNGILQTAGVNVPRYQDGELLVEGAVTNFSRSALALWATNVATLTPLSQQYPSPDGNNNAVRIESNDQNSFAGIYSFPPISGTTFPQTVTCSIFIKNQNIPEPAFVQIGSDSNNAICQFDLVSKTFTNTNILNSGYTVAANGFIRLWASYVTSSASGALIARYYAPTAGLAIDLFGFQLELGAAPTSYIPTTVAPVTRAADQIVISDYSVS